MGAPPGRLDHGRPAHSGAARASGGPERAAYLLGPVAELAAAATYQRFLDHIEVTERVYHAHDPADRLRAAVRR